MSKSSKRRREEKRRRATHPVRPDRWTPFVPIGRLPPQGGDAGGVLFRNSAYMVGVRSRPPYTHLSVVNLDHSARHDWRDFQRIKNELVGPEAEAVELYPRESRLIDTTNTYHLWARTDAPFDLGFDHGRRVESAAESGLPQREPVVVPRFTGGQRVWVRVADGDGVEIVVPATVATTTDANCTCVDDSGERFTAPLARVFGSYEALTQAIGSVIEQGLQAANPPVG